METPKKRSRPTDTEEELEIDVTASEPLSKRAARRLKKGKSLSHNPESTATLPSTFQDREEEEETQTADAATKPQGSSHAGPEKKEYVKGTNGIWIGNLPFTATESDLTTFFTSLRPLGKTRPASQFHTIEASDVVRISMPVSNEGNKGFAYLDFASPEARETAMALSERRLGTRNVLIKSADDFANRPNVPEKKDAVQEGTKILYIGNLAFDVTTQDLEVYLGGKEAGIKKVRMATFEDSGKCKGFAFVDFTHVDDVRKILKNKKMLNMNGRKLKMEFGQDRSLRRKPPVAAAASVSASKPTEERKVDPRSIKPGRALMDAPRASHAIVASRGEKVSFD